MNIIPGTPSIKAVAAAARVSVGTVSNVLNHPELVAEPTRERVLGAIARLGFVRNENARHLRARSSRVVGLIVRSSVGPSPSLRCRTAAGEPRRRCGAMGARRRS